MKNPPIQLLVNYWEIRSTSLGERLDSLLRTGISHVATFVPWQAVESDISHTLSRFLQAVYERKMKVSLYLTPEVGVHYTNSGLPKDLFSKPETMAKDAFGQNICSSLPPNAFALPSLLAPEFSKRYQNFLTRMDALLADLERSQPNMLAGVTAVLSGSLWKYYRSPRASASQGFAGPAGDHSSCGAVSYRQGLEQFYSQREFAESGVSAVNRWKTRQYEEINRRWFNQHAEEVFRARSAQFVRKRAVGLRVQPIELFTPEADPGFAYSQFLQMVSGTGADFTRLSSLLDESALRASSSMGTAAPSYVHWTGMGGFRSLADAEKQFLILKSLLLMGGRGGGVLIDESEWFSLSHSFRTRAETLSRALSEGELTLANRVLYLTPHLWSAPGVLWDEVVAKVGPNARMIASLDLALQDQEARLLMVDPSTIITRKTVLQLVEWAKAGRVVVFPRSPLYSEAARRELEGALSSEEGRRGSMEIDLGVSYKLHPVGDGEGRLIVYDLPENALAATENLSAWQSFLASVLAVAGIQPLCSTSDGRLRTIALEKRGGGVGLFVMNGTGRAVAGDLFFPNQVSVSDLVTREKRGERVAPASRFALEVPPRGILPIAVDGASSQLKEIEERRAAYAAAALTEAAANAAAKSELPGFQPGVGFDSAVAAAGLVAAPVGTDGMTLDPVLDSSGVEASVWT